MPSGGGRCTEQLRTRVQSLLHVLLAASLPVSQDSPPHLLSLRAVEGPGPLHKLGSHTVQWNPPGAKTPRLDHRSVQLKESGQLGCGTITQLYKWDLPSSWLRCHLSAEMMFLSRAFNRGLMSN